MSIDAIKMWHERARPAPTEENFNVQLGCHLEEVAEMLGTLEAPDKNLDELRALKHVVEMAASRLKSGYLKVSISDRKEFLDAAADQIVTAVGAAHCAKMNIAEAVRRVNHSNWSKYDSDGKPIFNPHGKIMKGPFYVPPSLEGLY